MYAVPKAEISHKGRRESCEKERSDVFEKSQVEVYQLCVLTRKWTLKKYPFQKGISSSVIPASAGVSGSWRRGECWELCVPDSCVALLWPLLFPFPSSTRV